MKRTAIIAALALVLLLSACGEGAQDAPTPTPAPVETPDTVPETSAAGTPDAENVGLSALSEWALGELEYTRSLNYQQDNDATHIRKMLRLFLYMRYEQFADRVHGFPDFSAFLDSSAPGYDSLRYLIEETRYIHLSEDFDESVAWYNVDLDFESIEIDGESASAVVSAVYETVDADGVGSAMHSLYRFELRKLDGAWYLAGVEPDSIYGSDRHGTYEELLQEIAALEA